MQLTMGETYRIFLGIRSLEQEGIKLSGKTRLRLGMNLALIEAVCVRFEQVNRQTVADINKTNRLLEKELQRSGPELDADANQQFEDMRVELAGDFAMKIIPEADLKLDENPKIGAVVIQQLLPILKLEE